MGGDILLTVQVYGLAVVISLLVAVMIRGVVSTLSSFKKAPAAPPAAPAPVPIATEGGQDHVAAIAAAVYAVLGAVRIVHIEDAGRGAVWTTEGRLAHHASHNVPHQPKR